MEYQSLSPASHPPPDTTTTPHFLFLSQGLERAFGDSWFGPVFISSQASPQPAPRRRALAPQRSALLTPLSKKYLREVRHWSLKIYCDLSEKWINEHIICPVPQPRCAVCLIKCGSRQSQPGLTCTFYLSFCLSEEFKCVMNKAVVIWNIIPLHWWNYKDGESSQITLIVFYHERCPCWGCGAGRKGRAWMNSDSTVRGLGVQHGPASLHRPVMGDAKGLCFCLCHGSGWTH